MKKIAIILAAFLGLSGLAACSNNGGNNAVVVETKSGNITQQDLYNELKKSSGDQVLQNLVYEKILEDKYNVSKKAIDQKYNDIKKSFPDKNQFKAYLAQNNLTDQQFRRQIKDYLMMQKAQREGIKVTDKDLHNYYDKNQKQLTELKASHILVKDEKTAKSIQNQLKEGADFAQLAKKKSTDTGSKDKGGELGWFKQSTMTPAFSNAAMKLKVGQISGPVKSENGYHIIKLEGKKESYDQLKSSVREAYLASKEKPQDEVMQKLIKDAKIEVKDKDFKDLFNTSASTTQK
ncbi:peptidylprolyl isomerase [Sporolactobacillus sp. THM7-7]|nr:peptidylprolyl isomerase [Sporolactobacillus sp. THM7-7]